jgi:hypothetical protein
MSPNDLAEDRTLTRLFIDAYIALNSVEYATQFPNYYQLPSPKIINTFGRALLGVVSRRFLPGRRFEQEAP